MSESEYRKLLKDRLIEYRNSLNLPKNLTFGVEIEYENIVKETVSYLLEEEKNNNPELIGWVNKSEFDIAEYNKLAEETNGEISSKILIDEYSSWESLSIILNMLERNDGIITNKCGTHINIGAHILENNKKYWRNFFLLWILYEKEIYNFSKGEFLNIRIKNSLMDDFVCNISRYLDLNRIINLRRKKYLYTINPRITHKSYDIYVSPNVKKEILIGNRIEFRIPNGTLRKEICQNYINFFAKFVLACKKELDIEKTLYKIENKKSGAVELANYIFDNDIDKENFLIQTLKTNKVYKKELPQHKIYY